MSKDKADIAAEIRRLTDRIEFLNSLRTMNLTLNQRALRELDRMLTADPETYEAEQKLLQLAREP